MPAASAEDLRSQGTDAFKAFDFQRAVDLYSLSLAVDAHSEDSALSFSNRAAARIHLYEYDLAILDAEIAQRLRPNWSKPVARRAEALSHLRNDEAAIKSYEQAMEMAEDDATRERYKAALTVVRTHHDLHSNKTTAGVVDAANSAAGFYARYQELVKNDPDVLKSRPRAALAVYAYEAVEKAWTDLDDAVTVDGDEIHPAMPPSPVLDFADAILIDNRGWHMPKTVSDPSVIMAKLDIQLNHDARVLDLEEYLDDTLPPDGVVESFSGERTAWDKIKLRVSTFARQKIVKAFLSSSAGDFTAAMQGYLNAFTVLELAQERWKDVDEKDKGASIRFTFLRAVQTQLLIAAMEGHHDKPGCSLFDGNLINGIATDIINGCQRDRVPAEPREHFQAYQIQPLVEAIQALAWLAAQDAASPRHHQMDSSGKVLYFGQQASKTAGDYYLRTAELLSEDDPALAECLWNRLLHHLRAGGLLTVEQLYAAARDAEKAMTRPELIFGTAQRAFPPRMAVREICDQVRAWCKHDELMDTKLNAVPLVLARHVKVFLNQATDAKFAFIVEDWPTNTQDPPQCC